ncbi:MAG: phosphodiesterase [Gemmatales bacterium]|nr:MAG: phosphodiesterase [Gemmatales bacterium]
MRILLVSDIHANWPALRSLDCACDICICLGDNVDYGVEPQPCVDWIRERAGYSIRGNHDHDSAQNVVIRGEQGFRYLTAITRPLTRQRLSDDALAYLGRLPVTEMITLGSMRLFLVHATPVDPLEEYGAADVEFWRRRLEGIDADFICVGHTHRPLVLEVGQKTVVNPGSVGLPRDGDPRGSYAIIEDGCVTLHRFEYPIDEAIKAVEASPLPEKAKDLLSQVYRSGGKFTKERPKAPRANATWRGANERYRPVVK